MLVVSHDRGNDASREDAHIAIHESFRAAHRELERWRDERRGLVKNHTTA